MGRNIIVSKAYKEASLKVKNGLGLDSEGHSFAYYYQVYVLNGLSESEILLGIIAAYNEPTCDALHYTYNEDELKSDECRYFKYPVIYGGGSDHFNMRWFKEWCESNNPSLIKRLQIVKTFW